ncbi:MAG: GNAT family N-acetyltransferase [Haliscomenobacteraceae bacterium CHB4]|nr:GNAT family N-acetyltransferase [Haliscomenobacteraceae bacterium CHB4]
MLFTTVTNPAEVQQILELQAQNLVSALTAETMATQGFVTVRHEPDVLQRMNEITPAIIAQDGDRLAGYALVMPREFAPDVPILVPMFRMLDGLSWNGRLLRDNPRWFVMGQICVAEDYRGMGIFDGLYLKMKEVYRPRYDFTVTEVAERNTRSMRAHERVGFQTLHVYPDATTGEVWRVIVLEL